ncbi:hypothetical protein WJX77_002961 [Trebouxia sp. C0004]
MLANLSGPLPPDARFVAECLEPGLQSDCRTILWYDHKRAGLGRLVVRSMNDEGKAAQKSVESGAPQKAEQGEVTLFDKIVSKQIPATILYEDETALAFKDINPQAPVHFLVIPKNRDGLTQLSKCSDQHEPLLGHLIRVASKVALQEGCEKGFRTVINDGPQGCQSVYHLHVHVFGGKQLGWPPC